MKDWLSQRVQPLHGWERKAEISRLRGPGFYFFGSIAALMVMS